MQKQLDKIQKLMGSFEEDSTKAAAGNKAAGVRARKTSLTLAGELKVYRSLSLSVQS